jgi:hypothetical protein
MVRLYPPGSPGAGLSQHHSSSCYWTMVRILLFEALSGTFDCMHCCQLRLYTPWRRHATHIQLG